MGVVEHKKLVQLIFTSELNASGHRYKEPNAAEMSSQQEDIDTICCLIGGVMGELGRDVLQQEVETLLRVLRACLSQIDDSFSEEDPKFHDRLALAASLESNVAKLSICLAELLDVLESAPNTFTPRLGAKLRRQSQKYVPLLRRINVRRKGRGALEALRTPQGRLSQEAGQPALVLTRDLARAAALLLRSTESYGQLLQGVSTLAASYLPLVAERLFYSHDELAGDVARISAYARRLIKVQRELSAVLRSAYQALHLDKKTMQLPEALNLELKALSAEPLLYGSIEFIN